MKGLRLAQVQCALPLGRTGVQAILPTVTDTYTCFGLEQSV